MPRAPCCVKQRVRAAEGPRPEEARARRQRARMRGLDASDMWEQVRPERLRPLPPQDRDQRSAALGERRERTSGHRLPAPAVVRAGRAGAHGEVAVQQQHPAVGPRGEVAMRCGRQPQVVVSLPVDVHEAARQRPHVPLDREREADRMPGGRIRVLPHHDDPHGVERQRERPQHELRGRQHRRAPPPHPRPRSASAATSAGSAGSSAAAHPASIVPAATRSARRLIRRARAGP